MVSSFLFYIMSWLLALNYFTVSFLRHSPIQQHGQFSNTLNLSQFGVTTTTSTSSTTDDQPNSTQQQYESSSYLDRVTSLTDLGDWQSAYLLLDAMPSPKCPFAMSSAIASCGKFGQWQRAQDLFSQCLPDIDLPLLHSFLGALTRCNRVEEAELCLWQHCDCIDSFSVNLVLQEYRRQHKWQALLHVFRKAHSMNCTDINCYVSTISACNERNQFSVAFELLHELQESRRSPSNHRHINKKLQSMVFKRWSKHRLEGIRSELAMVSQNLVDRDATARLLVSLGTAADEGVMPAGFAIHGARAGYVLDKIVSRSSRVADFLLEITEASPVLERNQAIGLEEESVLSRLLQLPMLSLGGGPGFDVLGAALLAEFNSLMDLEADQPPLAIEALVSDYEAGWTSSVDSVVKIFQSSSSCSPVVHHRDWQVDFCAGDITASLAAPANRIIQQYVASKQAVLVIASYVVAENALTLRASNFAFVRELVQATAAGSVFLFLETTHRLWPEIVTAAYAGIDGPADNIMNADLVISFPRVSGKRGFGLSIRKIQKADVATSDGNTGGEEEDSSRDAGMRDHIHGTTNAINHVYRRMLTSHKVEVVEMMRTFEMANTDHLRRLKCQDD